MTRLFTVASASIGAFLILQTGVIHAQSPTNEYRAYWADAFHAGFRSAAETTAMINTLRAANCNAVIPEIRKRADAYYNGSPYEPKASDISPSSYDPLADLLAQCHDTSNGKQRIEVHAWLVTYKTSGSQPAAWMHKHFDGTVSNNEYDPGHPKAQQRIFDVSMDIVSRYDIDGLNYDYIRYPEGSAFGASLWGYNDVTVARFNARYNRTGLPDVSDPVWNQFRRDQVTALLRKIYLNVMAIKPWVKISADTITWNPSASTATQFTNNARAYNDVLQDWRGWMEEGILDLSIPMNYYRHGALNYAQDYINWMNFAKDHQYGRHTIIGPGVYMNFATNVITQMRLTREPSPLGNYAKGVCGYSYAVPVTNSGVTAAQVFQALTQPSSLDTNPVPIFAERASIPDMPWKSAPTKGHLMGYITGGNATNYLDGAEMSLTGPVNRTFISDATGFFGSVELPPGSYTVTGSFAGYPTRSTNIVVTNGLVTSANLVLASDIVISAHPQSQSVQEQASATFTVTATGSEPLTYQWKFNNGTISNATASSYTIDSVTPSHGGNYSVVVSNATGAVVSSNALLTVLALPTPPTIVNEPQSQIVIAGNTANFSVSAQGTDPMTYQWRFQLQDIPGATNSTLSVTNVQLAQQGNYSVIVSNSLGFDTSVEAALTMHYALNLFPEGGVVIVDPAQPSYAPNSTVTLSAVPNANYSFTRWTGDATGSNNTVNVTLTTNTYIVAQFTFHGVIEDIILDNPEAERTGTWTITSSFPGYYGTNYSYSKVTNAAATASTTYRPVIPADGNYDVYLWYTAGGNRTTNAPWLISGSDGDTTVFVNQQNSGGAWRLIAQSKPFAAGTNGYIQVSNTGSDVTKVVMADGVRLVHVAPPVITAHPQSKAVTVGEDAMFFVGVNGGGTLNYEWRWNATNVIGGNTNFLVLTNTTYTKAGEYSVIVTSVSGTAASSPAQLTVSPVKIEEFAPSELGKILLELNSDPGNLIFEGTSDFLEWLELTNVIRTNGHIEIIDPVTNAPMRVYRTKSP